MIKIILYLCNAELFRVLRRTTRKHLLAVDETKRVLVLSPADEGKVHDKPMLDSEELAAAIPDQLSISGGLRFSRVTERIH